jgi:hypothetical protein
MQWLPLEDPEGYLPLLLNSPKGSPEGAFNNEISFEVGSSHSLEGFIIVSDSLEEFKFPPNPLLSIRQDAHFLWMNSSGEIFVVENIEVPTGPNTGYGVDDPLFQSESFRTPTHTAEVFDSSSPPSSGHNLFGTLGMSSNQPMPSQMSETYVTYTVTLDHFTSTTGNFIIVSDQLLVGSHSILPL